MPERKPYIVVQALNSYLKGSVIIAISGHLATFTDAMVVSWLIGAKALTAVNIVIPILTLFSAVMIMMSIGVSIAISKALGNRDKDIVDLSFTSSFVGSVVIGCALGVATYFLTPQIIKLIISHDPVIIEYSTQYLRSFSFAVPWLIMAGVIGNTVRTDGNTKLVSIAVWSGLLLNVGLDILFVGYIKMGIAGAAWATGVNYCVVFVVCLFHFVSRNNTIRWSNKFRQYFSQIIRQCRLGFSTSLADILLAVSLFVINDIMIRYEGNEGIYCWAVCYQIFIIMQMILSGVDSSIFALGGTLLGEDDVTGLNYLYRRSFIYLVIAIVILSLSIIFFPEFFGKLFGNKGDDRLDLLPSVLKIFSIFIFPYAAVTQVRSIYTILDRGKLSLFLCVAIFALMIITVYITSKFKIFPLTWSFPLSAWLILLVVMIYTSVLCLHNRNLHWFSLIPKTISDPSYNGSIPLTNDDVSSTKDQLNEFLIQNKVPEQKVAIVENITGDIMEKILSHYKPTGKKKYFDINARIKQGNLIIILRDNGERLTDAEETDLMSNLNSGSSKSSDPDILDLNTNYFYMNEQNTFTLKFSSI